MNIILASNSPRRKELLELAKVDFKIITKDVEEVLDKTKEVSKQIEQIAYTKANAVAVDYPECLVIGADTVVVINDQILGKPKDKEDARRMMKMLQNNTHQVITGVALCYKGNVELFHEVTNVIFYPMTDEEIENYINSKDIYDKAGAYAIQGEAALYIQSIVGDYYNVMGLPISRLYKKIQQIKTVFLQKK